jgi:hypothetical protein
LGIVGGLGIASFAVVVALLTVAHWSFLRERGWHPVRTSDIPYPSILALSPTGWLQILDFAVLGMAVIALAAGSWTALEPRPTFGVVALAVAGIATLALTAPTDGTLASARTWHGAVHAIAFIALLVSIVLAALLLGWGLLGVPAWSALAIASIAAAIAIVILTVASFVFAAVGSLASILSIAVMLVWLELLAIGLVTNG